MCVLVFVCGVFGFIKICCVWECLSVCFCECFSGGFIRVGVRV